MKPTRFYIELQEGLTLIKQIYKALSNYTQRVVGDLVEVLGNTHVATSGWLRRAVGGNVKLAELMPPRVLDYR